MRLGSQRLYTRIYLHFLGVLLVVGLATTAVFAVGNMRRALRRPVERMTHMVATLLGEKFADRQALGVTARHVAEELEVDVTVRDPDGAAILSTGVEAPPLRAEDVRGGGGPRGRHRGPMWFTSAPIRDGRGAILGYLQLSVWRGASPLRDLRLVLLVGLVLGLAAVATRPLARRISWPVERLTEANHRFGAGDLGYRIDPCRWRLRADDELGALLRSWDEMAGRIQALVHGHKELLANVSHELRSPLTRVRMALALLPRTDAPDDALEARLRDIETDLGELDRLIEDVLTTSRLEQGGVPLHRARVDVDGLVAALGERARLSEGPLGEVTVTVDGALGTIEADGGLIKRAVWNLLENAAKYGAAPIVLSARGEAERVVLTVTDHGPGVPREERERIFQPFYQAGAAGKARTPSSQRGFGLGLTLAQRVAAVHGGALRLSAATTAKDGSEIGCRFELELPRR